MAASLAAEHAALAGKFRGHFGVAPNYIFFAPGRTELCGNHTDHQFGRVLCAAISLGVTAAVSKRADGMVRIYSEGFGQFSVHLGSLAPIDDEKASPAAFVRGVCENLAGTGFAVGGFNAYISSNIPAGSGLSSSAAMGVLFAKIESCLYNQNVLSPIALAKAAQYAETFHFGKPCGLMDQAAVSFGGVRLIDFVNSANPTSLPLKWGIDSAHMLMLVNTGGSHADLTDDYAAIPKEMCEVAEFFGKSKLAFVNETEFYSSLPRLRGNVRDRAILRAMHFFDENRRVEAMARALAENDGQSCCKIMNLSGRSSEMLLQNIYPEKSDERSLALGLAICKAKLNGQGAYRVHGGGFAGTVQALVPNALANEFKQHMEGIFGKGSVYCLAISPTGAAKLADIYE